MTRRGVGSRSSSSYCNHRVFVTRFYKSFRFRFRVAIATVILAVCCAIAIPIAIIVGSPNPLQLETPLSLRSFSFAEGFLLVRNYDGNCRGIASFCRIRSNQNPKHHLATIFRLRSYTPQSQQNQKSLSDTNDDCYTKSHSLTVCLVPPPPQWSSSISSETNHTSSARFNKNENKGDEAPKNWNSLGDNVGDDSVWNAVTNMRFLLRDPGFFRWPPHINLLYPFVQEPKICCALSDDGGDGGDSAAPIPTSILAKLRRAAERVEPFWISLDLTNASNSSSNSSSNGFGTFGGPSRGVLWVYPKSFRNNTKPTATETTILGEQNEKENEPILELQSMLEAEFPMCSESLKQRSFLPHMTLSSKFGSLGDARAAANGLDGSMASSTQFKSTPLSFWCREIYLLERSGDNGQFQRKATIILGNTTRHFRAGETEASSHHHGFVDSDSVCLHDPPLQFPGMPVFEENWVRVELEAFKARRRKNHKNRRGGKHTRKSYRARRKERRAEAASVSASGMSERMSYSNTTAERSSQSPPLLRHDTPEEIARKRAERKAIREGTNYSCTHG